jgi:small-conductance mechanosensitive channel
MRRAESPPPASIPSPEVEGTIQGLTERIPPILGVDAPLFYLGGRAVTIASLVSFVVFLLLALVLSTLLQKALGRVLSQRGVDEGVQYALNRLLHYAVLLIGAFLALDNLGISITALAGLGAILAIGIGFGLQNIAQNFVSGLILLLERPVKKGDFVQVGETRGVVRSIHARATILTTLDNVDIIVPNGEFITGTVTNQTFGSRRLRIRVGVGVAYGSDTSLVRETLERVASAHELVLTEPAPLVFFADFGESSLDFTLLCWISDPTSQWRIASDLRFAIDAAFREEGIQIPFPQRDLHLRTGWGDGKREVGSGKSQAGGKREVGSGKSQD